MSNKYNARKTTIDGLTFDSQREATRWCELQILAAAGEVRDVRRQVPFELVPSFQRDGKLVRGIKYVADFVYTDRSGCQVIEDVKGVRTDVYRIKRKLLLATYKPDRPWRFVEV